MDSQPTLQASQRSHRSISTADQRTIAGQNANRVTKAKPSARISQVASKLDALLIRTRSASPILHIPGAFTDDEILPRIEEEPKVESTTEKVAASGKDESTVALGDTAIALLRKREGAKFAKGLYSAIRNDHFMRKCQCSPPTIHSSKREAECGKGHLRFYVDPLSRSSNNLRVLQVKGDSRWHCTCGVSRHFTPTYQELIGRKRRAEDSELDLIEQNKDLVSNRSSQTHPDSMWSYVATSSLEVMANVAMNIWGKLYTTIQAAVGVAHAVRDEFTEYSEARRYDAANEFVVVKRLKRQHCVPVNFERVQEGGIQDLPYHTWADDVTTRLGSEKLSRVLSVFETQFQAISDIYRQGGIDDEKQLQAKVESTACLGPSLSHILELYAAQEPDKSQISAEAQPRIGYHQAFSEYGRGLRGVVDFMQNIYMSGLLDELKTEFPVPPTHLPLQNRLRMGLADSSRWEYFSRHSAAFLTFLLAQKHIWGITLEYQVILSNIIVDVNAVDKEEMIPSFLHVPSVLMPGSYHDLFDQVRVVPDEDPVKPRYEVRFPEEVVGSCEHLNLLPFERKHIIQKPILKQPTMFDAPREPTYVPTPMKKRTLSFRSQVAKYEPPSHNPVKLIPKGAAEGTIPDDLAREDQTMGLTYYADRFQDFLDATRDELREPKAEQKPMYGVRKHAERAKQADGTRERKTRTDQEKRSILNSFFEATKDDENHAKTILEVTKPTSVDALPLGLLSISSAKLASINAMRQIRGKLSGNDLYQVGLAADGRRRWRQEGRLQEALEERRKEDVRRTEEERCREEEERRQQEHADWQREREEQLEKEREVIALGLRFPSADLIPDLPSSWSQRISSIYSEHPDTALAQIPRGEPLRRRDFVDMLLGPEDWLNDNIINGSVKYIAEYANTTAGDSAHNPSCVAFDSFFYKRLDEVGIDKCQRLTRLANVRQDNFLDMDTILIPICKNSHWTLAVIRPQQRIVAHMDSMRGGAGYPAYARKVYDWVKFFLGDHWVADDWRIVDYKAPMQSNGFDCGVFTITNAACLALGVDPMSAYRADQLRLQRLRIAAMLLNGGYTGDLSLRGI